MRSFALPPFFDMKNGAALVTVLIFVLLISMASVSSIFIMTNQARLVEKQVRRIIAFYSCQAGLNQAREEVFSNPAWLSGTVNENGQSVSISYDPATEEISSSVNYF